MLKMTDTLDTIKLLINPSFTGEERTPLTFEQANEKEEALDYVNDHVRKELRWILRYFADIHLPTDTLPTLKDIYAEGVLIDYPKSSTVQSIFVPFRMQKKDPIDRLYYLVYEARLRHGELENVGPTLDDRRQYTITDTTWVSKNMLRLSVRSDKPLPQDDPGYAYRFALTTLNNDTAKGIKGINWRLLPMQALTSFEQQLAKMPYGEQLTTKGRQYVYRLGLAVMKRLPEKTAEEAKDDNDSQTNKQTNKQTNTEKQSRPPRLLEKRYYTLRQCKSQSKADADRDAYCGEVDIYIHAGSPGSEWAKALQKGDVIFSDYDYQETIKNMTIGQPLLICDETSMPSVAAMLERWHIDTLPIVIAICNDRAEFAYMQQITLADSLKDKLDIHYINASTTDDLSQAVIAHLKSLDTRIDCAWGAIGKKDFKPIKAYLREEHGLKGKINRIRAYWR